MNRASLFDWKILFPVILLSILSLTTLLSINQTLFGSQIIFILLGMVGYILFSWLDYRLFRRFSIQIYAISALLLFMLLFIGSQVRGATRWLEFMSFRIQFSEILKPFFLLSLAAWLSQSEEIFSMRHFVVTLFASFLVGLLIFLEPDLGNALIYIVVSFLLLFYVGFPLRYFVVTILIGIVMLPFGWFFLRGYQKERIISFFSPHTDPQGISYNVIQAIIAVGSGELFGRGLGLGTQSQLRFLPERHTDFIFATFSEEFGFIGAVVIIILFAAILYRIFVIAQRSQDGFGKLFAMGCFLLVLYQGFMNIGMNIGVVPIAGVTLPFMSYGGSSLLANFILLGVLSSVARGEREKDVLEIH